MHLGTSHRKDKLALFVTHHDSPPRRTVPVLFASPAPGSGEGSVPSPQGQDHDDGVVGGVGVVAFAGAGLGEPQASVERAGRGVARAHLKPHRRAARRSMPPRPFASQSARRYLRTTHAPVFFAPSLAMMPFSFKLRVALKMVFSPIPS